MFDVIVQVELWIVEVICVEFIDQCYFFKFIVFENYVFLLVLVIMGIWFFDKYVEGIVGYCFYVGC